MTKTNKIKNEEFIKEYEALCLKHKVFIVTDYDGLSSIHLDSLSDPNDPEFKGSIEELKRDDVL